MKKILGIIIVMCVAVSVINAQKNAPWNTNNYKQLLLNPNSAYSKDNIKKRKPVVLPPIREADVVWSKIIWRIIDVREKMNQHFYFPQKPTATRQNLMDILLDGIKNHGLTAYDIDTDEFETPISYEEIMKKLDGGSQKIQVRNQLTGELEEKTVEASSAGTSEVLQFMLKEEWVFDKSNSTLRKRIIGICPIRVYEKQGNFVQPLVDDNESTVNYENEQPNNKLRQQLFWIYFPEARPLLAVKEAFKRKNNAHKLSYDDVFIMRYFTSFITRSSDRPDGKAISDYAKGLDQIIEAERIKEEVLLLEDSMWEY